MQKIMYSIEGNIGSGKSTLLALLSTKLPNIQVCKEPVQDWQHIGKYNLLQHYYQDQPRWAYTFQTYAIMTRMALQKEALTHAHRHHIPLIFSERSIMADKYIFAKLLRSMDYMTDMEYQLYEKMFADLQNFIEIPRVHKFIYLRTSPTKCLERIKKRARSQQLNIQLNYLNKIDQLHQEWLSKKAFVVDGEGEFESDQALLHKICQMIQNQAKQALECQEKTRRTIFTI